jgi:hypothetical protein
VVLKTSVLRKPRRESKLARTAGEKNPNPIIVNPNVR